MPAFVVTVLVWVGTKAASAAASAAVSKLVSIPVDKVLGIEVEGATVGARMEAVALGLFTGNMVPDPTYEQKVAKSFRMLETQLGELKKDLTELKNEMSNFQWQVQEMFDAAGEESLWKDMLTLDHKLNTNYAQLTDLWKSATQLDAEGKPKVDGQGKMKFSLEDRRRRAVEMANAVVTNLESEVENTLTWLV